MIAELERRGRYLGETREDAALGVAAGAYLGGRRPVVIMQNSGLGVSLNALGSLHILYEMPVPPRSSPGAGTRGRTRPSTS